MVVWHRPPLPLGRQQGGTAWHVTLVGQAQSAPRQHTCSSWATVKETRLTLGPCMQAARKPELDNSAAKKKAKAAEKAALKGKRKREADAEAGDTRAKRSSVRKVGRLRLPVLGAVTALPACQPFSLCKHLAAPGHVHPDLCC